MMKIVLKLDFHENKCRTKKAFKKASGLSGVEAVALDSKDQKLTLTGDIDPVVAVSKLRKVCHTDIVFVGPTKEPEKKKEEPKKDPPKKDPPQLICYPPPMYTYGYHPMSYCYCGGKVDCYCVGKVVEEHPSMCVIC